MITYMPKTPGQILTFLHTKPICIVDSLDDLRSDINGEVVLPNRINWTPTNHYNLNIRSEIMRLYAVVLNEAVDESDLCQYINRKNLIELWKDIPMARHIRAAWESIYYPILGSENHAQ